MPSPQTAASGSARCASIETGERRGVALLADVPVVRSRRAGGASARGRIRPCGVRPEVDAVGEDRGQQRRAVLGGPAAAGVGEAVREAGPAVHLQQEVGDAGTRQEGVGVGREPARLGRHLRPDAARCGAPPPGPAWRRAARPCARAPRPRPSPPPAPRGGTRGMPQPPPARRPAAAPRRGARRRSAAAAGSPRTAVAPAAPDPDVARPEPVAQLGEDADLPGPAVGPAIGVEDEGSPGAADEARRRIRGQDPLAGRVHPAEQCHGPEQSRRARGALEFERLQQRRREAAAWPASARPARRARPPPPAGRVPRPPRRHGGRVPSPRRSRRPRPRPSRPRAQRSPRVRPGRGGEGGPLRPVARRRHLPSRPARRGATARP